MYSLRLTCAPADCELISAELWDAGTLAVGEFETGDAVLLVAGFASNEHRDKLLAQFQEYSPEWRPETTDWVRHTQVLWPARNVGSRVFLAPVWCDEPTPPGRVRLSHNPGLACGTGEHPCTQLALEALERSVHSGIAAADIGTGSGLLAIAALCLGARTAVGVDTDLAALHASTENFSINRFTPVLVNGSADSVATGWADVTLANISATVLLNILDDLRRITKPGGMLILTGFPEEEMPILRNELGPCELSSREGWCCLEATVSGLTAS